MSIGAEVRHVGLGRRAARGAAWAAVGQGSTLGLHYLTLLVLAWHLAPADFGLVGLATIYIFILNSVGEMGLGAALVQRPDLGRGHVAAAFWLSLAGSTVLGICLWMAAGALSVLMREPRMAPVLRALALMVPLNALLVVPRAMLQRDLAFGRTAATEVGAEATFAIVGIALAGTGWGAWSLVGALLARHVVRAVLLWCAWPWRPVLGFTRAELRAVLSFGSYVMGSALAWQIVSNLDYFVVGRYLGATALGYYTLAFQLAVIPVKRLCEVLSRVAFPSLALIQNDRPRVRRAFVKILDMSIAMVAPFAILLSAGAGLIVRTLYGEAWVPAVLPLQILAITALFYTFDSSQAVFRAVGRPALELASELLRAALFLLLVAVGQLRAGVTGIALALLLATAVTALLKVVTARMLTEDRAWTSAPSFALALGVAALCGLSVQWPSATPVLAGLGLMAATVFAARVAWQGRPALPKVDGHMMGTAALAAALDPHGR